MPNVSQGTQKVLFAYQLQASVANVLNPYIAAGSSEIVVRVEWPVTGRFAAINNPSAGVGDIGVGSNAGAAVRPVMAIPAGAVIYSLRNYTGSGNVSIDNFTYDFPQNAIAHTIASWATVHNGYPRQGIDILIPGGHALYDSVLNELTPPVYIKVLVHFSDGSQDDLWVRLMPPDSVRLSLNDEPPHLDGAFSFQHVNVPGSSDEHTGIATYNISKAYVRKPKGINDYNYPTGSPPNDAWYSMSKNRAADDALDNVQFLSKDVAYTPFAQPWGAIVFSKTNQPYSGRTGGFDSTSAGDLNTFLSDNFTDYNGNVTANSSVFQGYSNSNFSVPGQWAGQGYGGSLGIANFLSNAAQGSNLDTVRYFTRQYSFLTFVTGQWDNTWTYRGYASQAQYQDAAQSMDDFQTDVINLNNFFGISPQSNFNGTVNEPLGESTWGLKYGWFGWTGSTGLYKKGGDDTINTMWGIPMFWSRTNAVPFTKLNALGPDNNPDIYALGSSYSTGWGFEADEMAGPNFYGKFTNTINAGTELMVLKIKTKTPSWAASLIEIVLLSMLLLY